MTPYTPESIATTLDHGFGLLAEDDPRRARLLDEARAIHEHHVAPLLRERDHWRDAAVYLADCHAATAESASLRKSTGKGERGRLHAICRAAATLLRGSWLGLQRHAGRDARRIAHRCSDAADVLKWGAR